MFNSCLWWGKVTTKCSRKVFLEAKGKHCSLLLPYVHRPCRQPGKGRLLHPSFLWTPVTLSSIWNQLLPSTLRLAHHGMQSWCTPCAEQGGNESWVINKFVYQLVWPCTAFACSSWFFLRHSSKAVLQGLVADPNLNNPEDFSLSWTWKLFEMLLEKTEELISTEGLSR